MVVLLDKDKPTLQQSVTAALEEDLSFSEAHFMTVEAQRTTALVEKGYVWYTIQTKILGPVEFRCWFCDRGLGYKAIITNVRI